MIRASPLTAEARLAIADRLVPLGRASDLLLDTLECFLRSNGSTSSAARTLFVHRNTVTYRLRRIEQLTGAGVRTNTDRLIWTVALIVQGRQHVLDQLLEPGQRLDSSRTARVPMVRTSASYRARGGVPRGAYDEEQ